MKLTQLAFIAFLVAAALSKKYRRKTFVMQNVIHKDAGLGQKKTWTMLSLPGPFLYGTGRILHFASLNADLVINVFDEGDGKRAISRSCTLGALVNGSFHGSLGFGFPIDYCGNSSVTKINNEGSVLFLNGDES